MSENRSISDIYGYRGRLKPLKESSEDFIDTNEPLQNPPQARIRPAERSEFEDRDILHDEDEFEDSGCDDCAPLTDFMKPEVDSSEMDFPTDDFEDFPNPYDNSIHRPHGDKVPVTIWIDKEDLETGKFNTDHPDISIGLGEEDLFESKLSAEDRKNLNKSTFGIPSLKKYPLNDKKHVSSAITYFNKVDPEHEEELAKNIKKAIKKFDMHPEVSADNRFSKYYQNPKTEAGILMDIHYDEIKEDSLVNSIDGDGVDVTSSSSLPKYADDNTSIEQELNAANAEKSLSSIE